ncbi:hypothetical protein ACFLX2_00935 [Candidatus Dependentiae bacterium]
MNKKKVWFFFLLLQAVHVQKTVCMRRFVESIADGFRTKQDRLRRAMLRKENEKIILLLEGNEDLVVSRALLREVAQETTLFRKLVMAGPFHVWRDHDQFHGYSDVAARLIIEHLDEETRGSPWLLHAAICSERENVLAVALDVFEATDCQVNDVAHQIHEQDGAFRTEYDFVDFIIWAENRHVITKDFADNALSLFFERGLCVGKEILRECNGVVRVENAFEAHFHNVRFRPLLVRRLARESRYKGRIAKLLVSIDELNIERTERLLARVAREDLFSAENFFCPLRVAMCRGNDAIGTLVLDRALPFIQREDDGGYLLILAVVNQMPESAERLLAIEKVPVHINVLFDLPQDSDVFGSDFATRLLRCYMWSGGTCTPNLIAHLFGFTVGRAGEDDFVAHLRDCACQEEFDRGMVVVVEDELPNPLCRGFLCREALGRLSNIDFREQSGLPLLARSLQTLNVQCLRLAQEQGGNLSQAVALLRWQAQHQEEEEEGEDDEEIGWQSEDQELLEENELVAFWGMDPVREDGDEHNTLSLRRVLVHANDHLLRHRQRGLQPSFGASLGARAFLASRVDCAKLRDVIVECLDE